MAKEERDSLIKQRAEVLREVEEASFHFFGDLFPGSHELDEGAVRDAEIFHQRKEDLLKQLSELNRLLGLPECSREPLGA